MKNRVKKNVKIFLIIFSILLSIKLFLTFLPYPELKIFKQKPYSLHILDRNNNILRILPLENGDKREYVPFRKTPRLIKKIFLTSEDKRFYFHYGFDLIAITRSFYLNLKNKYSVSGASTITMQLSRIISPHKEGYQGKISEIINAVRLEAKLSKKEIFELWLNSIPYGSQAIGIGSASKIYFGKNLTDLSPAQILALSIIPRRPAKYDPLKYPDTLKKATLDLADRIKYTITKSEIDKEIDQAQQYIWEYKTPHFVNFVANRLSIDNFSKGEPIRTSLDLDLNQFIQEKLHTYLQAYKENRLNNGAVLVLNNNTGEILSYVGSQDFFDKENSGEIDGIHILNQPGSCLKPFLYGLALEYGFYPSTILPDIPLDFGGENIYIPANFNLRFNGPVRLRVALASSLNVTSVYLITRVGVKNFIEKLLELDINSLEAQKEVLGSGLAVGNAEISLLELTRAFAVFPRQGKKLDLTFFAKNENDHIDGERIYSEYTASMICDILSDDPSRALGFGTNTSLNTSFPSMFKTGTSDQFGNIWAIGAVPDYTVGVWIGNFSGDTVIGRTGSSVPAALVLQILRNLVKNPEDFFIPDDLQKVIICPLSGGQTTDLCSGAVYEYFPKGIDIPKCDYHFKEEERIIIKYPPIYSSWVKRYGEESFLQLEDIKLEFPKIIRPKDGATFYFDPTIKPEEQVIKIEIINRTKTNSLSIYINGKYIKDLNYPYIWHFPIQKGEWSFEASDGNRKDKIRFIVN